jgi:hypothetical protein
LTSRATASDVVFFCGKLAVSVVRGAHESILSRMLQEIIADNSTCRLREN